jgi:hypothetical protein
MRKSLFVVALVAGVMPCSANGDVVATFTYNSLAGSYSGSGGVGTFTALAANVPGLRSSGNVSRLVPVGGTSLFQAGFVAGVDPANFAVTVSVNVDGAEHATGAGSFTITDADGDTITGSIAGDWTKNGNFLVLNGILSGVSINDNGSQDGMFNGTSADSTDWALNIPGGPNFDGALVSMIFSGTDFFVSNFSNRTTNITAQLIPAPGVALLFGLGTIVAGVRRRS